MLYRRLGVVALIGLVCRLGLNYQLICALCLNTMAEPVYGAVTRVSELE